MVSKCYARPDYCQEHWCEIDPACPTPNLMAPGKRWAACMAPVHVFREEGQAFWFSIATPGSYGILHTTVLMLRNIIDFSADCQAAIEAPRFRLYEDTRMQIETRIPPAVLSELAHRGHQLEPVKRWCLYGTEALRGAVKIRVLATPGMRIEARHRGCERWGWQVQVLREFGQRLALRDPR